MYILKLLYSFQESSYSSMVIITIVFLFLSQQACEGAHYHCIGVVQNHQPPEFPCASWTSILLAQDVQTHTEEKLLSGLNGFLSFPEPIGQGYSP